MNLIRYPFFAINLIFMIFGILVMSFGILLLTNYSILDQMLIAKAEKSSNYTETFYRSDVPVLLQPSPAPKWLMRIRDPASYLLIGFGAAFFTLSFLGYFGSVKDSRGLMVIYAVLLGLIIVFEIVGVVLYIKYKPDLKSEVADAINKQYKPEEMQRFTRFEFILDLLMVNYKCCGVNNEKDFKEAYSHFYSVRSLSIDPRHVRKGKIPYRVSSPPDVGSESISSWGESEMKSEEMSIATEEGSLKKNLTEDVESRVVTGVEEPSERQVPVSCCKLNITSSDAVKMLRNIYRNQEDKLQLLDYAIDDTCVIKPDETNAYVGDSHGCFDKIQGEISTLLRIGLIVVGLFQVCGLVFALFIFKTAYYDWLG